MYSTIAKTATTVVKNLDNLAVGSKDRDSQETLSYWSGQEISGSIYPTGFVGACFRLGMERDKPDIILPRTAPNGEAFDFHLTNYQLEVLLRKNPDIGWNGELFYLQNKKEVSLVDYAKLKLLGLSSIQRYNIKNKNKSREGLKGIGSKARRMVESSAKHLQDKHQRRNLAFLTCTIPNMQEKYLALVAKQWNNIQTAFFQELKRLYERRGESFEYVSVVEVQEERWRKYRHPGSHIHAVFAGRSSIKSPWVVNKKEYAGLWEMAVRRVVPEIPKSVSFGASTRIEVVRKSASGYLAKYLSKGVGIVAEMIEAGFKDCVPHRWWSISKSLKAAVELTIIRGKSAEIEKVYYWIKHGMNDFFFKYGYIREDRDDLSSKVFGFWCQLKEAGMKEINRMKLMSAS